MITPQLRVKAHQYLYYVLAMPVWSDYEYDRYCSKHDIQGGGGSDLASSYTPEEKDLAGRILLDPTL